MGIIVDEPLLFRPRRRQDAFRTSIPADQTKLREEVRGFGDRGLPGMIPNLEALGRSLPALKVR